MLRLRINCDPLDENNDFTAGVESQTFPLDYSQVTTNSDSCRKRCLEIGHAGGFRVALKVSDQFLSSFQVS
jgi:hypothetical protein